MGSKGAMSPLPARLTVDNSVISALQEAGALGRVLEFWPGAWVIPESIRDEARAWKTHGSAVLRILDDLSARGIVEITSVDPRREGPLLRRLPRALGQGEAAAIAIAFHRGYGIAIDDRRARLACEALDPPVRWISTESILAIAMSDGFLTRDDARSIWTATGIIDPRRSFP